MDYNALKTLIQTHPSWPSVADDVLTAWVNEVAISATRPTVSTGTLFACIAANIADFNALSADNKQVIRDILYIHSGEGVPTATGSPARTLFQTIFAGKTGTLTAVGAAITYQISRAEAAGVLGMVRQGDVEYARSLI
jgi:hypothetical protein